MSNGTSSEATQNRFDELVNGYQAKLPHKLALLLPFKTQIEGLLAKQASYDDIRILLEDVNVVVSKNTIFRFCHTVVGRPIRQRKPGTKEISQPKLPQFKPQPTKMSPGIIQAGLQQEREQFPGPWSRRKRGPRIANSKNL